jgi:UDP-N-acetylmuramyl pentapeptide phosphotransferase/UDP-N-acetylglucosamine-1-phosphate transferase
MFIISNNHYLTWEMVISGIILPFLSAMVLTFIVHPFIVKIAKERELVDNPDARKLQKKPVPVLGGIAVFWGIVVGAGVTSIFFHSNALFTCIVAMTVMLFIGSGDDLVGLSPIVRLFLEVLVIAFIVKMDGTNMNDFHGLFGIGKLPVYYSLPLTAIAGCGIINAINMIDGVDGLSSGFCVMACLVFGVFFTLAIDGTMSVMCCLSAGALIPFFIHNVFGKTSKMFIGDGGSTMMGMLMVIFCLHIIDNDSKMAESFTNMGVIAFCLSVLSVPVFDTLRVMIGRIAKGISPFKADKSHLHHLFIEMGFSHIGTSVTVITLDFINILIWMFVYYGLEWGPTKQFAVVVIVGLINTCGIYYIVRRLNHNNIFYRGLEKVAKFSHQETWPWWLAVRRLIDKW